MNTIEKLLTDNADLSGSLRILTGATYSGKRAVFIAGTPEGLRFLAELLLAQADAPNNVFSKLERDSGNLFFTTADSVDTFEMHNTDHPPAKHQAPLEKSSYHLDSDQTALV